MFNIQRQLKLLTLGRNLNSQSHGQCATSLQEYPIKKYQNLTVRPVIGLEVHAQLEIQSKLFSCGSNNSSAAPNSQLDLFDISLPGSLPTLNGAALRAAILTGLGLNCAIQDVIHFDRKNYFYTDMPAGYQITQYSKPIAKAGYLDFIVTSHHRSTIAHSQHYDLTKYVYGDQHLQTGDDIVPYIKRSHIKQLQLEQDSAKTLGNAESVSDGVEESSSLIDYNRSGTGLIEIVFEPDLVNHHEAASCVKELIRILKLLRTCDCELQEGSLRVDANVSIRSINNQELSDQDAGRVELKNLNSLKSLTKGIQYEIERQALALSGGKCVPRESRTFNTRSGQTVTMRAKESSIDYRYVPEPNIPMLRIEQRLVTSARDRLASTKMPAQLRQSLSENYNLNLVLINEMENEPGLAEYFCAISEGSRIQPDSLANFLIYAVANLRALNSSVEIDLLDNSGGFLQRISVEKMQKIIEIVMTEEISYATAFDVMKLIYTDANELDDPRELVTRRGWLQVSDESEMMELCKSLVEGMKNASKQYRKKREPRHMWLLLSKMHALHGHKLNVRLAIKCLDKLLQPEVGGVK